VCALFPEKINNTASGNYKGEQVCNFDDDDVCTLLHFMLIRFIRSVQKRD